MGDVKCLPRERERQKCLETGGKGHAPETMTAFSNLNGNKVLDEDLNQRGEDDSTGVLREGNKSDISGILRQATSPEI
jgi:hypothetical protein